MIWTNKYKLIFRTLVCFLIIFLSNAYALTDLGIFGNTYKIAETDSIIELEEKAAQVNWEKVFNRDKAENSIKNYKPDLIKLQKTDENNQFLVDMTYSLKFDIPDGKGGILYPKGFSFNPLEYINFHRTLVIFDGTDDTQVKWCKNTYGDDYNSTLLISDGSYYELSEKFGRPVFYASADIIIRFKIKKVPSIIKRKDNYIEVREIVINDQETDIIGFDNHDIHKHE